MTRWVAALRLSGPDAGVDALSAATGRVSGVQASVVSRNLPGSTMPGDATWDLTADVGPGEVLRSSGITGAEVLWSGGLAPLAAGTRAMTGRRIKRILLMPVTPGTPQLRVRAFEDDLAGMAAHVDSIGSWAVSHVDPAAPWTHAFEQEFADLAGLSGPYMTSHYHWAGLDRWFDGESPASIVRPDIAYAMYEVPGPVL